ncbi:hypothetical protein M0802_012132 [Mischocyttarus mexicanus]|nr:hypothetical protein M0802_012132 [Mischocyttarus mexicanus]
MNRQREDLSGLENSNEWTNGEKIKMSRLRENLSGLEKHVYIITKVGILKDKPPQHGLHLRQAALRTIIAIFLSATNNIFFSFVSVIKNSSSSYKLPYKTHPIIKIDDTRIYFCICLYQLLVVPVITFGYVGFDCLFINLAFHITAQFGILGCRVKETLNSCNNFRKNIKRLVFRHYKLIRQAKTLENCFNIVILQQLTGCTFQLCISGYNTLISTSLCNAFYCYEWYKISPNNQKMIFICMLRMKKPQQLTSGKFFILSLATFTDILKTSMGYLSVLRNFL